MPRRPAALAAQRGSAQDLVDIETAFDRMKAACSASTDERCEADLSFDCADIAANHNVVPQALGDTPEAALRLAFVATARLRDSDTKVPEVHFWLVE